MSYDNSRKRDDISSQTICVFANMRENYLFFLKMNFGDEDEDHSEIGSKCKSFYIYLPLQLSFLDIQDRSKKGIFQLS